MQVKNLLKINLASSSISQASCRLDTSSSLSYSISRQTCLEQGNTGNHLHKELYNQSHIQLRFVNCD